MKIIKANQVSKLYQGKRPKHKARHVGLEIEFFSTIHRYELEQYLVHAGLEDNVEVKDDGSICLRGNANTYEITLVGPEKNIHRLVNKLCDVLKAIKAQVNSSCGLHVHLDMRQVNAKSYKRIFGNLVLAQPVLYGMVPKSRLKSEYSKPTANVDPDFEREHGYGRTGINPHSYHAHRTIEVRIHSGTVNAAKINNWIKLLLAIRNKRTQISELQVLEQVKISKRLRSYVRSRNKEFYDGGLPDIESSLEDEYDDAA